MIRTDSGYVEKPRDQWTVAAHEFVCRACRLIANKFLSKDGKRCPDCVAQGFTEIA